LLAKELRKANGALSKVTHFLPKIHLSSVHSTNSILCVVDLGL